MLISVEPISLNAETDDNELFTLHTFLSAVIVLLIKRVLSSFVGNPNSFNLSVVFSPTNENSAVTSASVSPVLISSREVRKPSTALIESSIIDLPAPVSPVSTLNPLENSISAFSIIAMFLIFKTESIQKPYLSF